MVPRVKVNELDKGCEKVEVKGVAPGVEVSELDERGMKK